MGYGMPQRTCDYPPVDTILAFAPATVANVGPGFDVLGFAVAGLGDRVRASKGTAPGLSLTVSGPVPAELLRNTAGIAAVETVRAAGLTVDEVSIELHLEKGLPVGSGLGSSAASAAAAATAVNVLLGTPLTPPQLVAPCLAAEAAVSGRHADNIAPSLLGGLVLVRSTEPLDLVSIPVPRGLHAVVVTPDAELQTEKARAALPKTVPLEAMVRNVGNVAAFVAACYAGDLSLLARSIEDVVVTPARAALIPGATAAIDAAVAAGALGASISGAGPSVFALAGDADAAEAIGKVMVAAFDAAGLTSNAHVTPVGAEGARCI